MRLLTDRSDKDARLAILATWGAFTMAVCLALPQPPRLSLVVLGAVIGALLVLFGFAALSRIRPLPVHVPVQRVRLAGLSLLAGATIGAILVAALFFLARAEPALRARFANRPPIWRPFALGFEASITEEVMFRLLVLSVVAWVIGRWVKRPGWAAKAAAVLSALLFALAHVPSWSAVTRLTVPLVIAVLVLNGAPALFFAFVFWRWGLPYAILCHFAADVVVQSVAPRLLG